MTGFFLSYGHFPVALTVNYHYGIWEYIKIHSPFCVVQEKEYCNLIWAEFVLATEQDIGDVLVEPHTDW